MPGQPLELGGEALERLRGCRSSRRRSASTHPRHHSAEHRRRSSSARPRPPGARPRGRRRGPGPGASRRPSGPRRPSRCGRRGSPWCRHLDLHHAAAGGRLDPHGRELLLHLGLHRLGLLHHLLDVHADGRGAPLLLLPSSPSAPRETAPSPSAPSGPPRPGCSRARARSSRGAPRGRPCRDRRRPAGRS